MQLDPPHRCKNSLNVSSFRTVAARIACRPSSSKTLSASTSRGTMSGS